MTGLLGVAVLALSYEWWSIRAGTAGRPWSQWRGASFLTGCAVLALALGSSAHTFTGHMTRHLLIGMVAPLALVLGAPITLVLRSLPVRQARRVTRALRTPGLRFLTHPATALLLTVGTLVLLYCTPLYARIGAHSSLHPWLDLHFLLSGLLFTWAVAGPDPAPHRPSVPVRLLVLGLAIAAHATLSQLLYAGIGVHIPVGPLDRQAGATIMYYGGDLTELLLAGALVATWRPQRRTGAGELARPGHQWPVRVRAAGTPEGSFRPSVGSSPWPSTRPSPRRH